MKFDTEGNIIPKISKIDAHFKIQQNLRDYNNDVMAKNTITRLVEAVACAEIEGFDLSAVEDKITPELRVRVNTQKTRLLRAIRTGFYKIDHNKLARNMTKIKAILEAEQ